MPQGMTTSEQLAKVTMVGTAFSPSAPIDRKTLFAGRVDQLKDVLTTVTQRGQHAVIFGERGVGKTSLANVILEILGDQVNKADCGPINCDSTMDFSALWRKAFREMHTKDGTLADLLPDRATPDDIRHVLQRVARTLIVFDEADRIVDRKTTALLADTIKNLSDHSVETTIVIVGVADSVDALIAEHVSIERNLVQIRMPRMSDAEILEIIDKGASIVKMTIEGSARKRIARLSQGLPHYAHLLCLHAFQSAAFNSSLTVTDKEVTAAIAQALKKAQQSVVSAYQRAVTSPRDNLYKQVLLACALADTDSLGYFYAGDVRDPMSKIMGRPYEIPAFSQHLNAFCEGDRGPILKRTGTARKYRFRFVNPLMQPYVIMHGIESGLLEDLPESWRG